MLVVAKKRELIAQVPEFEWLKAPRPDVDFLTFEEADCLIRGAAGEWRTMVLLALRTGLRQGEILAPRWDDVDLKADASRSGRTSRRESSASRSLGSEGRRSRRSGNPGTRDDEHDAALCAPRARGHA
jgi:integrase